MKRLFPLFLALSLFFSPSLPAYAKKAVVQQSPKRVYIGIFKGYEQVIGDFLKAAKKDSPEKAYALTGKAFQDATPFEEFVRLLSTVRLQDTVGKKWFEKKGEKKSVAITGEFSYSDGSKADIVFTLSPKANGFQVDGMRALLTMDMVKKSFPAADQLKPFIAQQIESFRSGIVDDASAEAFFATLSQTAQKTVKLDQFKKAMNDFKAQNRDTTLPSADALAIDEEFPQAVGTQLAVQGHYQNEKFFVTYRFLYDFEAYQWKVNSFSVQARALAEVQKEQAEKEAARKAALEKRAAKRKKVQN